MRILTINSKHGLSCFLCRLILVTPSIVTNSNLFLPTSPKFGLRIGLAGNVIFHLWSLYFPPFSKFPFESLFRFSDLIISHYLPSHVQCSISNTFCFVRQVCVQTAPLCLQLHIQVKQIKQIINIEMELQHKDEAINWHILNSITPISQSLVDSQSILCSS
jgi:hypothetical protein